MNTFIRILFGTILFGVFLALLNLWFFTFNLQTLMNGIVIWMFTALLPFKGMINLPAVAIFILRLALFQGMFWAYHLVTKFMPMFTGDQTIKSRDAKGTR